MTDYPSKKSSWRRKEVEKKWRNLLGIFVTLVLLLAVLNGILKTLSFSKHFKGASWNGQNAISFVVSTKPTSVFIYNPSDKDIVLVRLDEDLYFETGDLENPIERISSVSSAQDGKELIKLARSTSRTPVSNYLILDNNTTASEENLETSFKSFVSPATPLKIILGRGFGVKDTNIAQIDMIKLWWQLKSLSAENLTFIDTSPYRQEIALIKGDKVMGVDEVSLHRLFAQYLENQKILEEGFEVEVENVSGDLASGQLAVDFISSMGARVRAVSKGDSLNQRTIIGASDNSYTAEQLAKIFDCDIVALPNLGKNQIKVVIGEDFLNKF